MEIVTLLIAAALPLVYWRRLGDAKLDRDFGPYAYPGLFKTGYLEAGHRDVKPPFIHWGYWAWLGIALRLNMKLSQSIRLLAALGASLTCLMIGLKAGGSSSIVLALLLVSPYLWMHMANTEWLTISLIALSSVLPMPMVYLCLGLLPLVNQKNLLLIAPAAWAIGILPQSMGQAALDLLLVSIPTLAFLITNLHRSSSVKKWLWTIPKDMGKARTFRVNTLQSLHLLIPFLIKLSLIISILDWRSPWFIVLLVSIALTLSAKQIVPHHFILWALPISLCAHPTPLFFVGWIILWFIQDFAIWRHPQLLYPLTFRFRNGGDYGQLLDDAEEVYTWLAENIKEGEAICVNGIENQIYIEANRPASKMQICEAQAFEPIEPARVIIHCGSSAIEFDYKGYEHVLITPRGLYTIMRRKTNV